MSDLLQIGLPWTKTDYTPPAVRTRKPLTIYTIEPNIVFNPFRYLPFSTGLLRAYAEADPTIKTNVRFMPFIYETDTLANLMAKFTEPPDVAAFSVAMWNERLNLAVAKEVKRRWPKCLVVFGGCHVPHHPKDYMTEHPFIDLCIRAEGEEAFREILLCVCNEDWTKHTPFFTVMGVTYRAATGEIVGNEGQRHFGKDLDVYPSPYLKGLYDSLMENQTEGHRFQAIFESNRGCNWNCDFCLVKGSKIYTVSGEENIEDVLDGELVLGWDETRGEAVWNITKGAFCVGMQEVVKITAGEFSVEATKDHKFFTKRGWVEAGNLVQGDEVLSCVRRSSASEVAGEDLLEEVSIRDCFKEYEEEQPNEAEGYCCQGRSDQEEENSIGRIRPIHVYVGGASDNEPNRQGETVQRPESHEECRSSEENGKNTEGEAFGSHFRIYDCSEPHAECGVQRKGSQLVEGSRGAGTLPESYGGGTVEPSESVRETGDRILGEVGVAVPFHGGLQLVDRSEQGGQLQEPGFHTHGEGSAVSDSCPRQALAQQHGERRSRDSRLSGLRVGVLRDLGRRHTGRASGKFSEGICWVAVDSVVSVGNKPVYDLVNAFPNPNFFANGLLAHNCYWGQGGLLTRYRFHSIDYVKDELTWMGKNRVPYVFGADSNWGQHPRDWELTEHIVKTKREYGYPLKYRVCYGKNTDEKIYKIGSLLHENELEKGITLARQSNDPSALKNIHRDNISLDVYRKLQVKFSDRKIPVYIELILGMPGETLTSWKQGVIDCLSGADERTALFCYWAQLLPNTGMHDPAYRQKHGIVSKWMKLTEIHSSERPAGSVQEYEEIVIGTASMPHEEWRRAAKFSWAAMLLHTMKLGFFVLGWLENRFGLDLSKLSERVASCKEGVIGDEVAFWESLLDRTTIHGEARGTLVEGCGDVYFDVEEASVMHVLDREPQFYRQLEDLTIQLLKDEGKEFSITELCDVFWYQRARMPFHGSERDGIERKDGVFRFVYNLPEYFDKLFGSSPVPISNKIQTLHAPQRDWGGDRERFARECVFWGRKSGEMLVPCTWENG